MQLDLTTDQEELRDSVRAVLAKECSPRALRTHVDEVVRGGSPASGRRLWDVAVGLDWPALTVPEKFGGVGLGCVELAIVAEEFGRAAAIGPLPATMSQFVPAVREAAADAEQAARWLEPVAHGRLTGTLAVAEASASWHASAIEATATPTHDGGYVLAGSKAWVVVDGADEVVCALRLPGTAGDDGITLTVVPLADVAVRPIRGIDPSRGIAHLGLDGVRIPPDRVLGTPGHGAASLRRALEEAAVALAMDIVGASQTILDTTVAYAKERVQFGVPIGSFQAVKHKLVNMFVAIERARAIGLFAALCIAEDDDRRAMASSMAKAAAGDCQRLVAQDGIQLLGGIGYTWEHDQHLFVKRAKASDPLFGSAAFHRARVAELLGL